MTAKNRDLALIAVIIVIACAALFLQTFLSAPAAQAEVSVDGQVVEVLDLTRDGQLTVTGSGGGTNLLVVQDGQIWCQEASCPDKVCISQGKQREAGSAIVCLPNRLIVTITGSAGSR